MAVVDGTRVLLTTLGQEVIPPPLFSAAVQVHHAVQSVAFKDHGPAEVQDMHASGPVSSCSICLHFEGLRVARGRCQVWHAPAANRASSGCCLRSSLSSLLRQKLWAEAVAFPLLVLSHSAREHVCHSLVQAIAITTAAGTLHLAQCTDEDDWPDAEVTAAGAAAAPGDGSAADTLGDIDNEPQLPTIDVETGNLSLRSKQIRWVQAWLTVILRTSLAALCNNAVKA